MVEGLSFCESIILGDYYSLVSDMSGENNEQTADIRIFVVRTRTLFFARRPGIGLMLAVACSAIVATM